MTDEFARGVDLGEHYIEVFDSEHVPYALDFSCGNAEIDKYFRNEALVDCSGVSYVYRNYRSKDIIGLASLSCSAIILNDSSVTELIPAIKVSYFAVSEKYQDVDATGGHYYISDNFLCLLIQEIRRITESYVGATHIILYSVPDAVHFYRRNLFTEFEEFMKPERCRYLDGCIPMYMPI